MCDPADLAELLTPADDAPAQLSDVSNQLCALDAEELSEIFDFLLGEIDLSELLEQVRVARDRPVGVTRAGVHSSR